MQASENVSLSRSTRNTVPPNERFLACLQEEIMVVTLKGNGSRDGREVSERKRKFQLGTRVLFTFLTKVILRSYSGKSQAQYKNQAVHTLSAAWLGLKQ